MNLYECLKDSTDLTTDLLILADWLLEQGRYHDEQQLRVAAQDWVRFQLCQSYCKQIRWVEIRCGDYEIIVNEDEVNRYYYDVEQDYETEDDPNNDVLHLIYPNEEGEHYYQDIL